MKKYKKFMLTFSLALSVLTFNPLKASAEKIIINHDVSPGVNVRSEKNDKAPILGGIDYQDIYEVKDEDKYWITVSYKGQDAYVGKKWFLKLYDYKLIEDAPLKETRSNKSKTLKTLKKDKDEITILKIYSKGIAKVIYDDTIGYVDIKNLDLSKKDEKDQERHKDRIKYINSILEKYEDFGKNQDYEYVGGNFIKERKDVVDEEVEQEEVQYIEELISYEYFDVTGTGSDIYWYATKFIGNPYVYGGNDLLHGIDCSGFTQQVYGKFGIGLPRIAQDQYYVGKSVRLGEERAGDLVFYGTSPSHITHVAIADGNGGIVHASSPRTGIITSYIGNPIGIKRIVE